MSHASGDISEQDTWKKFPRADIVIHLAALTFVPDSWKNPADFTRVNLLGTMQALEYCKTHTARMVFPSTYMYGNPDHLPITEDATLKAFNPYALSKKMAEDACLFYSNQFNIPITVLRPFNVYGPGQKDSFLIPSIIKQVLSGSDIIKVKTLEPRRDYVYVDDLVIMIIKVFELNSFNIFNVGTGKSFSVEEVIQKIQQLTGTSLKVVARGDKRHDEVMDTRADMTKAKELLQWQLEWTLDNGLTEVLRKARMDQLI